MVTENGKRFFGAKAGSVTLTLANGNTSSHSTNFSYHVSTYCDFESLSAKSNTGLYLCFGNGITEPTKNDVTLSSVINGFTHINGLLTVRNDNDSETNRLFTHTKTVQYIGDEDIVINEVGLFFRPDTGTATGEAGALLAREVLDEPITMSKGDMRSFTFNIEG